MFVCAYVIPLALYAAIIFNKIIPPMFVIIILRRPSHLSVRPLTRTPKRIHCAHDIRTGFLFTIDKNCAKTFHDFPIVSVAEFNCAKFPPSHLA